MSGAGERSVDRRYAARARVERRGFGRVSPGGEWDRTFWLAIGKNWIPGNAVPFCVGLVTERCGVALGDRAWTKRFEIGREPAL